MSALRYIFYNVLKGYHLVFYSLIDHKSNPQLYRDKTYPPAKFDVD